MLKAAEKTSNASQFFFYESVIRRPYNQVGTIFSLQPEMKWEIDDEMLSREDAEMTRMTPSS